MVSRKYVSGFEQNNCQNSSKCFFLLMATDEKEETATEVKEKVAQFFKTQYALTNEIIDFHRAIME